MIFLRLHENPSTDIYSYCFNRNLLGIYSAFRFDLRLTHILARLCIVILLHSLPDGNPEKLIKGW